jgi:hypothetical protein
VPHLAVAAGKDGRMFILNRDNMGRFQNPDVPQNVAVGASWCGPSYFRGADGVGRVVSSGGFQAKSWKVNTAASPALALEASAPTLAIGPQDDGGFFTSVSSNGTKANTAIVWAVGRPIGTDNHLTLFAYNATASVATLPQLWSGSAGHWPNLGGNANSVPTVANGRVYVPSNRQLSIFGLRGPFRRWYPPPWPRQGKMAERPLRPMSIYWGTIKKVAGTRAAVALRTGKILQVDLSEALDEGTSIAPVVGRNVGVTGTEDADGILQALRLWRAKGRAAWGADSRE